MIEKSLNAPTQTLAGTRGGRAKIRANFCKAIRNIQDDPKKVDPLPISRCLPKVPVLTYPGARRRAAVHLTSPRLACRGAIQAGTSGRCRVAREVRKGAPATEGEGRPCHLYRWPAPRELSSDGGGAPTEGEGRRIRVPGHPDRTVRHKRDRKAER